MLGKKQIRMIMKNRDIDRTYEGMKMRTVGLKTGFTELDDLIGGLQKGKLYVLGSRPAMGKTAFGINIARNVSISNEKSVLYVSFELGAEQLISRFFLLFNSMPERIMIEDSIEMVFIEDLCKWISDMPQNKKPDVIIIDYFQFMTSKENSFSLGEERSSICKHLKQMAKEMDSAILLLSQVSRQAERRTDFRPVISDLEDVGIDEQSPDVIMTLYRENYYKPEAGKSGITEVIIRKNDMGATGTVELDFIPEQLLFVERSNRNE